MITDRINELENSINELEEVKTDEKHKIKTECLKIRIEWYKTIGTMLSIIGGIIAFCYNFYLENEKSKTNFQLKALEIIMNSDDYLTAKNKAIVMHELFPNQIPKDLPETLEALYPDK